MHIVVTAGHWPCAVTSVNVVSVFGGFIKSKFIICFDCDPYSDFEYWCNNSLRFNAAM